MNDDLKTCQNFIRQTREYLRANQPVMAYIVMEKVEEYAIKAAYPLKEEKANEQKE